MLHAGEIRLRGERDQPRSDVRAAQHGELRRGVGEPQLAVERKVVHARSGALRVGAYSVHGVVIVRREDEWRVGSEREPGCHEMNRPGRVRGEARDVLAGIGIEEAQHARACRLYGNGAQRFRRSSTITLITTLRNLGAMTFTLRRRRSIYSWWPTGPAMSASFATKCSA